MESIYVTARVRNAEATREKLVLAAFDHFQRSGYNATGLRDVLREAETTSGALFHHFANKEALALSVLEGPVAQVIRQWWIEPLRGEITAADALRASLRKLQDTMKEGERRLGCPLGNSAAEMSTQDSVLAAAVRQIFDGWRDALAERLGRDIESGVLRSDRDPSSIATFVICGIEGAIALTKVQQSVEPLRAFTRELDSYLCGLERRT